MADHFKSSRYRLEVTTDDFLAHDTSTGDLEDDVIAGLTNETLVETLRQLAPEQQECLVMRFLQGWSIAEAARALDRSEGAIKQLQLRALRNLAKLLPERPMPPGHRRRAPNSLHTPKSRVAYRGPASLRGMHALPAYQSERRR